MIRPCGHAIALVVVAGCNTLVKSLHRHPVCVCRTPMIASADAVQAALLSAAEDALAGLTLQGGSGADAARHRAEWLKDQLLEEARLCIGGWHTECRHQLGRLLAAEQLCPEQSHFEALRQRLQEILTSPGGQYVPAGSKPTKPAQPEGVPHLQVRVGCFVQLTIDISPAAASLLVTPTTLRCRCCLTSAGAGGGW